jgi:hypothetical protein
MKSMLALSLMFASMSMANHNRSSKIREEYLPKQTEEEKKRRLKSIDVKINKARGLTEFFYGDNSLWAINQKNADKKAKKNNWL